MSFYHQQAGTAYYSEFDEEKAYWLRELMREGHIAPGTIDARSIEDVSPIELAGFVQHHFFAGVGVWSYAARLAGWPDDQPLRTLSCPCQPFSAAGEGGAFDDPRHLWPAAAWHIEFSDPRPTFGEQVASRDGLAWLDVVSADMEAAGYSIAAFDLCSAGFGAPHNRSRLYFVAEGGVGELAETGCEVRARRIADERGRFAATKGAWQLSAFGVARVVRELGDTEQGGQRTRRISESGDEGSTSIGSAHRDDPDTSVPIGVVAHSDALRLQAQPRSHREEAVSSESMRPSHMAHADDAKWRPLSIDGQDGLDWQNAGREEAHGQPGACSKVHHPAPGPTNGFWRDADWVHCRPELGWPNGRWRPVEPGSFPLAHGASARMVRLRGYGDAINAQQAAAFIRIYRESKGWQ